MPRVTVPADKDPLVFVWGSLAPALSKAAVGYSDAVYSRSGLPLRETEAARITVATINDCELCRNFRTARDVPGRATDPGEVPEEFYDHIGAEPDWDGFTDRERLAAEFAQRYCADHLSMDDAFWARVHTHFSDEEIVDLALCVASWLALGRFNRVFDIDGACRVPVP